MSPNYKLKHFFSCLSSDRNHEKICEYEINTTSVYYVIIELSSRVGVNLYGWNTFIL